MSPTLNATDVVRIRNRDNKPWSGMWNSQTYTMGPLGEAIVPFIAACNWFGHPDAADVGPRDRHRTDEYQRLRIFYGVYDNEELWDELTPNVDVFTLDGSEKLIMVIDDPTGAHLTPTQTSVAERDLLQQQLQAMQQQMAIMQAQLDMQNRETMAVDQGDLVTDDAVNTVAEVPSGSTVIVSSPTSENVSEDTPTRVKVSP